ncbi:MAG: 2-C-methyl-D-erythritol 4-phosphate cytidylyltransferase [Planctomycetes bacterium]|nr:2-C-methyl-D-erythritol 4-phosphate cytidylyltransferase [Planctomycetota bacterium]
MPSVSLIIPGAGEGKRMGSQTKKPFLTLGDEPILLCTLRAFGGLPAIREAILVLGPAEIQPVQGEWGERLRQLGVTQIVAGGARRQDSVWNGLQAVSPGCDLVLIHDAVRPLVRREVIEAVIQRAEAVGAAIAAAPMKATVKQADHVGLIRATVPREDLWMAQTPQGFRRNLILAAFERARAEGWVVTDDAQIVERFGHPVEIVPDTDDNLKITTPEDLVLARAILEARRRPHRAL